MCNTITIFKLQLISLHTLRGMWYLFMLRLKLIHVSTCEKDRYRWGWVRGGCGNVVLCTSLRWRHNGCDSVSNHQPHHCLLNRLFGCRSKKTSKLRVTGLCAGNSPGTGSPVNSPLKWPVTQKMFPFDDVIMVCVCLGLGLGTLCVLRLEWYWLCSVSGYLFYNYAEFKHREMKASANVLFVCYIYFSRQMVNVTYISDRVCNFLWTLHTHMEDISAVVLFHIFGPKHG